MKSAINRFCMSLCLERHPLIIEKPVIKESYLNVLSFFIEKYCREDRISIALLENYKAAFLGKGGTFEKTAEPENLKNLLHYHLKGFKFITYRYILLCDLLIIISPFDKVKAREIADNIKNSLKTKAKNSIDSFIDVLFGGKETGEEFSLAEYHIECWKKNNGFFRLPEKKIIVSSNLSSGKSTLINAIAGKKINRSMNEACTSKLHYIYDKAFEDGYTHEDDYYLDMNANSIALMTNHPENKSPYISVASHFRFTGEKKARLCLIDSPGVNNSLDKTQEEMKEIIVACDFDIFMFVINAEYIGNTDDLSYLEYIKPHLKGKKILFVMNKLDRFRLEDDNIAQSIDKTRQMLEMLGFESPFICPLSAYAGFLAKKKLFERNLEKINQDRYKLLFEQFNYPEYNLSKYYDDKVRAFAERLIEKTSGEYKDNLSLLYKSGLWCLEILLYQGEY